MIQLPDVIVGTLYVVAVGGIIYFLIRPVAKNINEEMFPEKSSKKKERSD